MAGCRRNVSTRFDVVHICLMLIYTGILTRCVLGASVERALNSTECDCAPDSPIVYDDVDGVDVNRLPFDGLERKVSPSRLNGSLVLTDSPVIYDDEDPGSLRVSGAMNVKHSREVRQEKEGSLGTKVGRWADTFVAVIGRHGEAPCGFCTGTIITPFHILTAARCFADILQGTPVKIQPDALVNYYVRVGSLYCDKEGKLKDVMTILVNPKNYDVLYGIAVVVMKDYTSFTIVTLPPALSYNRGASDEDKGLQEIIDSGRHCKLLGWPAKIGPQGVRSRETSLESINVKLLNWSKCTKLGAELDGGKLTCGNIISTNKVPCPVAMGTPLMCDNIQYALAVKSPLCDSILEPLLYALISLEIDWLREIIQTLRFAIAGSSALSFKLLLILTSAFLSLTYHLA